MDRNLLKENAHQKVQSIGKPLKIVTLVYLLLGLAITGIDLGVSYLVENAGSSSGSISGSLSFAGKNLVISLAISVILSIASSLLHAGYHAVILEARDTKETSCRTLTVGTNKLGQVILLEILYAVFVMLWGYLFSLIPIFVITFLLPNDTGLVVSLIVSAIIIFAVSYRYKFCWYSLMNDSGISANDAIRESVAITKNRRMELFLLDLSFLPWFLLCILTCGIVLIWFLPYYSMTIADAYFQFREDCRIRKEEEIKAKSRFAPPPFISDHNDQ